MAYWQGDSYERARRGGYLWAPQRGEDGIQFRYRTNMTRVAVGDVIFSGCNQKLLAVSTADSTSVV